MSKAAAHLADHVIPHMPVQQWALSLPIPLRVLLAAQPELVTPVLQVVQRVVTRHLLAGAQLEADEGHGGAVTLIQRLGFAANLNIHLHCLVLYGVYCRGTDGAPGFIEASVPTDDALHALLQTTIGRLMNMLTRRGVLVEDMGQTYLAEPDAEGEEARTLRPLQASAATYRIAFGPRAGQKVLTLRGAMPREATGRITTRRRRSCQFQAIQAGQAATISFDRATIGGVLEALQARILAPLTAAERNAFRALAREALGVV